MDNANNVIMPADNNNEMCLSIDSVDQTKVTNAPYQEAIGKLMYLSTGTRPDITLAVNWASGYTENPDKIHWNAVKRILKDFKGTQSLGLLFSTAGDNQLFVF